MFENISVASLFVVSEVVMTLEENKKWFKEAKFGMISDFIPFSAVNIRTSEAAMTIQVPPMQSGYAQRQRYPRMNM